MKIKRRWTEDKEEIRSRGKNRWMAGAKIRRMRRIQRE